MSVNQPLRVIVVEDEDGTFAAQCLEYDICTQAATVAQLEQRLVDQIEVERMVSRRRTGQDFGEIPPAPDFFHKMWDHGMQMSEIDLVTLRKAA